MVKVLFVDPMSYNNMAIYDYNLLSNLNDVDLIFIGSKQYSYRSMPLNRWFDYSQKKQPWKVLSYIASTLMVLLKSLFHAQVVHFQWLKVYHWDYVILLLLKLFHKRIVITAHNILPHDSGRKYAGVFSKIYKLCDAVIVHIPSNVDELISMGVEKQKIHVVPHGVLDMQSDEKPSEAIKKLIQKSHDNCKYVFSFLGMIKDYKGIEYVYDLAKWIDGLKLPVSIVIAGKGEHPALLNLMNCKCTQIYNDKLTDSEFLLLLKNSSALLLPYKGISQSGLLLTSIAAHVPVIASPINGFKYVFNIEPPGILMKSISSNALCDAVFEFMSLESHLSINWKELNLVFNWDVIGSKTSSIYKSILKP